MKMNKGGFDMDETPIYKFKNELLKSGLFRKVRSTSSQYTCNTCPMCGDTGRHLYIKIDISDDKVPVMYNCFKCNSNGFVKKDFLKGLNLQHIKIPKYNGKRIYYEETYDTDKKMETFSDNDTSEIQKAIKYIDSRIGVEPVKDELRMFGLISKPCEYYKDIMKSDGYPSDFNDRLWFIMTNFGLIGRCITDMETNRWKKINPPNRINNRGLYLFKKPFSLSDKINVIVSEGIIDAIGLYYHHDCGDNNLFICSLGTDYESVFDYLISRGIFGKSVSVKIFTDSNDNRNNYYNNLYNNLFMSISLFRNIKSKDYGVTKDEIEIQKIIKSKY